MKRISVPVDRAENVSGAVNSQQHVLDQRDRLTRLAALIECRAFYGFDDNCIGWPVDSDHARDGAPCRLQIEQRLEALRETAGGSELDADFSGARVEGADAFPEGLQAERYGAGERPLPMARGGDSAGRIGQRIERWPQCPDIGRVDQPSCAKPPDLADRLMTLAAN